MKGWGGKMRESERQRFARSVGQDEGSEEDALRWGPMPPPPGFTEAAVARGLAQVVAEESEAEADGDLDQSSPTLRFVRAP